MVPTFVNQTFEDISALYFSCSSILIITKFPHALVARRASLKCVGKDLHSNTSFFVDSVLVFPSNMDVGNVVRYTLVIRAYRVWEYTYTVKLNISSFHFFSLSD